MTSTAAVTIFSLTLAPPPQPTFASRHARRSDYRTASEAEDERDRRVTTVTALTPTTSKPQIAKVKNALR